MEPVIDLTKEYGIVLEGGGAKGAYQIGAWKALKEAGVRIKGVAGTSVGALNGAFICMDDIERAEYVWKHITNSSVMKVDDEEMRRLMKNEATLGEAMSIFFKTFGDGGVDVEPLKELIRTYVREEDIKKSPIELFILTFNVDHMKELDLNLKEVGEGMMQDYLLASAYIFPLFKNEKIDGKRFIDGGAINNVPLGSLIERDYKDIIVIRIFGIGREKPVKIPEDTNVVTIAPRVHLGNMLDFDAEKSRRNMKIGYYDAKRVIYGLAGKIYYIEENHEECYYLEQLLEIPHISYEGLTASYHLSPKPRDSLRTLTEVVFPALALEFKLGKYWTYRELYLAVLEATAKLCKVPKYCIYTVEELKEKVIQRLRMLGKEDKEMMPAFIRFLDRDIEEENYNGK